MLSSLSQIPNIPLFSVSLTQFLTPSLMEYNGTGKVKQSTVIELKLFEESIIPLLHRHPLSASIVYGKLNKMEKSADPDELVVQVID